MAHSVGSFVPCRHIVRIQGILEIAIKNQERATQKFARFIGSGVCLVNGTSAAA